MYKKASQNADIRTRGIIRESLCYNIIMTTVTFDEDLQLPQHFESLAAFLMYLQEHNLMITLNELSDGEVTKTMQQDAEDALKRYKEDP